MIYRKLFFVVVLAFALYANPAVSAELEIKGFDLDPTNLKATSHPVMDLNAELCVIIRIESDVAGRIDILDGKARKTEVLADGITEHYVSYREQRINIKASGYMPKRVTIPFEMEPGKVYILRVQGVGEGGRKIKRSAEVKLHYTPESNEEVYGGIDGGVNALDFSAGELTLRPDAGTHTIRLNSKRRIWEKRYELTAGEKVDEVVIFTSEKIEQWDIGQPGGLYIESNPSSAMVLLNQVEQGVTPLTLKNIQPGSYTIEVVKDLYLPEQRDVEVKSLDFASEQFDLTPNFGRVNITSIPSGATVTIEGQNRGETPLEIPKFNAGVYTLKLAQKLYYDENDNFEIKPDGDFVKEYKLKPQFGTVKLTSEPSGAEVTVLGVSWGTTPLTRERVPSGDYIVSLRKQYYFDEDPSITVLDGETMNRNVDLRPSVGTLTVTSDPPGASVTVVETKKTLGKTPIVDLPMERGSYQLLVEKSDYEPFETAVAITFGGDQKVDASLKRSSGHIQVSTTPQKAKIYIDDEYKGDTPTVIKDVPTGVHEIRLDKKRCDIHVGRVTVKRNEVVDYTHTLRDSGSGEWEKRRLNARLISIIAPSGGQFYSGQYSKAQYVRGSIYGAAFLGGLAMAYLSQTEYDDQKSVYDTEMGFYQTSQNQVDIDTRFAAAEIAADKMQTASDQTNLFIYAAAGVYAIQLIDAWLWGGGPRPVVRSSDAGGSSIFANVKNGRVMTGVRFTLDGK